MKDKKLRQKSFFGESSIILNEILTLYFFYQYAFRNSNYVYGVLVSMY